MATLDEKSGREAREDLRERIVEAARDIVSEAGLDGLSMRALAERIGFSPGSIYLHFEDKEEILRSVMEEGFRRLGETMDRELAALGPEATALEQYAAAGRGYARFAVEHTGYFRTMFEMPGVANMDGCVEHPGELARRAGRSGPEDAERYGVALVRRAVESGQMNAKDPERAALVGWGVMHGLTSLYLSGHLSEHARSTEEFMELIESAIEALRMGWQPRTEVK